MTTSAWLEPQRSVSTLCLGTVSFQLLAAVRTLLSDAPDGNCSMSSSKWRTSLASTVAIQASLSADAEGDQQALAVGMPGQTGGEFDPLLMK